MIRRGEYKKGLKGNNFLSNLQADNYLLKFCLYKYKLDQNIDW